MEQNNALSKISNTNNVQPTQPIDIVQEIPKETKSFSIDKSSILIMVLLFMFSSKLWDIAWDIGKSLLYIIIIIYLLGFINQDLADNIKNIIHDFTNVNPNTGFLTDLFAKISEKISNLINLKKVKQVKQIQQIIPEEEKLIENFSKIHTSLYDGGGYLSGGNTKNLSNISRSDSKNIFK